jgi:hypothetical protein
VTARLAPSLARFWAEVNKRWPFRDHWSDGWLGDTSHATRFSDHNPDASGWVHAVDTDATAEHAMGSGFIGDTICATLLQLARSGRPHPINYIIYKGVIYSKTVGFRARAYTGSNSHHSHVHLSIVRSDWSRTWSGDWGILRKKIDASRVTAAAKKPLVKVAPVYVGRYQRLLVKRGLLVKPFVWGRFGKKTREATKRFAKANGFPVDAVPGLPLIRRLNEKAGSPYEVIR